MNTLFQHRHFHKFATYSAEIRWVKGHSLNAAWFQLSCSVQRWTFVKSGTELSTDHHLIFCRLRLEKQTGLIPLCKTKSRPTE